ncbi:MAG: preprotein translocase subunit SecY [Anaerolineae bacterium]|nr:preprotein translocase subunit SecY [Anaerolineae bacterium]
MIQALRNALTLPDLRRKLLYTVLILIIYRLAVILLPVPGVDQEALADFLAQTTGAGQFFNVLNMLSGGAIERFSVMANGVQSYITAQLIVQLLQPIVPALERLAAEGESGQRKLNRLIYYVTIPLSMLQSYGSIQLINSSYSVKILPNFGFTAVENILPTVTVLLSMVAGTMIAMWLGELISEQGIGNGISLIIFGGVVSGVPQNIVSLWSQGLDKDPSGGISVLLLSIILAIMAITMFVIVVVQEGQRRIPVQYGKRMRGMKMYGGGSTHIPLRVNTVGMIPLIFAQAILTFPGIVAQFFVNNESVGQFASGVISFFTPGQSAWYIPLYFAAVVGFTYFYTDVMVQQQDLPNALKRQGGFIPGIRPGKKTADFINSVYRRITLVGAVFLGAVAVLPLVTDVVLYSTLQIRTNALLITASGLIIVVGTVLDTMRQLEAQLLMRHYEGFI